MLQNSVINDDIVTELKLLALFNLASRQEGLKVHKNAGESAIAAAGRLHAKGLVSQPDGGYLTELGLEATEHLQAVLTVLAD